MEQRFVYIQYCLWQMGSLFRSALFLKTFHNEIQHPNGKEIDSWQGRQRQISRKMWTCPLYHYWKSLNTWGEWTKIINSVQRKWKFRRKANTLKWYVPKLRLQPVTTVTNKTWYIYKLHVRKLLVEREITNLQMYLCLYKTERKLKQNI